ncbi:hypothetical protein GRS48_14025 [Halorubrum sp. JWXQ-INN 858]|uniref:hypothetical protein n=1 Tax=Halorubrum sp. JWXQ-INN 858 TaxID=2690782 RepID=UPI00135B60C0|nr:hypothetical protein [Halorubrum sp. JWXQ-INN 858]MWV65928.1 hypothetical protein [Halorubrum sp. JWXQ-INN 858]
MSAQSTDQQDGSSGLNTVGEVAGDVVEEGSFHVPESIVDNEVWVTYTNTDDGRRVPCSGISAKPRYINAHDPEPKHLVTFEQALASVEESRHQLPRDDALDGTMLILGAMDGLSCIDLDDVIGDDGKLDELASDILDDLDSTYAEVSPSGDGVHLLIRDLEGLDEKYTIKGQIETYSNRGVSFSGRHIQSTSTEIAEIDGMMQAYQHTHNSRRDADSVKDTSDSDDDIDYEPTGSLADKTQELVDAMCEHDNTAEELYERGDSMSLGQFGGDRSRADMSLASKIYWWADESGMLSHNDYVEADIIAVFMSSDLAQRTKVQTRPDYVRMTVRKVR